jgi:5'-3' exonuclease
MPPRYRRMRQDVAVPGLLVLDSASLYYRAFYALPESMTSPQGEPVNAVRGFLDTLARLIDDRSPDAIACCWDLDWRPQWRVDLLPTYKTHRLAQEGEGSGEETPDTLSSQVPVLEAVLRALGVAVAGVDGFEADDVIGSLATQYDGPVSVVSGDRDLMQLVNDRVTLLYTGAPGKIDPYDPAAVLARFGVRADQYVDFAVMKGDPSDGLPGVPGVGEKTAAKLLSEHGDLVGIQQAAADPTSKITPKIRASLLDSADYIARAVQVVTVVRDLAVEVDVRRPSIPTDVELLSALNERWGLAASVKRFQAALAK